MPHSTDVLAAGPWALVLVLIVAGFDAILPFMPGETPGGPGRRRPAEPRPAGRRRGHRRRRRRPAAVPNWAAKQPGSQ